MAKFSEFMQHPRVAQLLNRLQGVAAPDPEPIDATVAAEVAEASAQGDMVDDDQVKTQDDNVAQIVTTNSVLDSQLESEEKSAPDSEQDPDPDADPDSDTVWEDALHSLPAPQRPLQRLLPMTGRVAILALVAVAMWWTWPRSDSLNPWVDDARAGDIDYSLAVVNPANIRQNTGIVALVATPSPDATSQAALFTNIVVVTPTPTSPQLATPDPAEERPNQDSAAPTDEPIVLEASSVVTDENGGTIIVEIPEAVPVEALMPSLQSEPIPTATQNAPMEIILVPTATPSPTPQIVSVADSRPVPKVEIVPAVGIRVTPTEEAPIAIATATEVPTATPPPIGPGRLWSTFTPLSAATNDHFWLGNPFENFTSNRFASPSYQFGSTAGNRYRPHHGLDFSNPSGTPVQAAVEGEVVHAGLDDPDVLVPYANFYGNAVVIRLDQQLPVAGGKLDVFVLYGHLSEVRAEVGQHVVPTDIIGLVGMSGIAIGPHLHVEARLGANTYDHSVNPYLWLKPAEGNGAVAVRVLTAKGRTWAGARVSIARFENNRAVWGRQIETYLDTENIGPDPSWGENGAMGDVPAGSYSLFASINGESVRADFVVNAGQTTFVEIRTEQ